MLYHITKKSSNKKTGNMVVVTSSRHTCPPACPFKDAGCYADGGPLRIHWDKVTSGERGMDFNQLIDELERIPR